MLDGSDRLYPKLTPEEWDKRIQEAAATAKMKRELYDPNDPLEILYQKEKLEWEEQQRKDESQPAP